MKSKTGKKPSSRDSRLDALDGALTQTLDRYFETLSGHRTGNLHQLMIGRVEKILLEYILEKTDHNLSRAARMLGISRTTLRNKIARCEIDQKIKGGKTSSRKR